jgi:hypothetical protein
VRFSEQDSAGYTTGLPFEVREGDKRVTDDGQADLINRRNASLA